MFKLSYGGESPEDLENLLPHPQGSPVRRHTASNKWITFRPGNRRRVIQLVLGLFGLSSVFLIATSLYQPMAFALRRQTSTDSDISLPPRYTAIRHDIATLPQHNLSLPFPEGSRGRYVKFSSQISQLGWNNVLNEVLLNAHLAYRSNRAYVFSDYDWKLSYYPWPERLMYEVPPRTPLAALMGGPVVGGEYPKGTRAPKGFENVDHPPRSVSVSYFDQVCPPHRRRVISTSDVKPWQKFDTNDKSGREIFDYWLSLLTDRTALDEVIGPSTNEEDDDDSCIEIVPAPLDEDRFPQVFDLWLWGSDRVLSLWEEFKASPIASIGLETSAVVERCVQRNMGLFSRASSSSESKRDFPLDTTLAVHVRRGDYVQACQDLADYNSTFYSWNQLPFLPDHFTPPQYPYKDPGPGNNNAENVKTYLGHCLPDDEAIAKKIEDSRRDWEKATGHATPGGHYLETLFLLTNEHDSDWLGKLKSHFLSNGWKNIVISSLEVVYGDAQEKDVGMAVDMDLARRAAVFIGNGFSSFTSNILHRRLVDGKIPVSNRFF